MGRYDPSAVEWRVIEPLLPNKPRGVARVDDRRVINRIFYVLRTPCGRAQRSIQIGATRVSVRWPATLIS